MPATPSTVADEEEEVPRSCRRCSKFTDGKDILWLQLSFARLLLASSLLSISYILARWRSSAAVQHNPVHNWALLVSILVFVHEGGCCLNWLVFKAVSRLALVRLFSEAAFYALALDGIVQHLTWIIVGVSD